MKTKLLLLTSIFQILGSNLPMIFGWGQSISERSDETSAIITPPGYAFVIWGPIYLTSLILGIYAVLPKNKKDALVNKVAWPAIALFVLSGAWGLWVPFYGTDVVSFIIIASMAAFGVYMMFLMGNPKDYSKKQQWSVVFPIALMSGWIIAATSISVVAVSKFHGMSFVDPDSLVVTMPVLLTLVSIVFFTIYKTRNYFYAIAPVWALSTLALDKYSQGAMDLTLAGAAGALIILSGALYAVKKGKS